MKHGYSAKIKLLLLILAICVLVCALAVTVLAGNTAAVGGKAFATNELYKLKSNVTPNGAITFEAEIYLPDAYHTQRSGAILSNYNGGAYTEAYAFEIMAGGKVRVFSQTHGDVTVNYDVTQHMGSDTDPKFAKIAVTVDTSTGAIVLYVNGEQKATATNTSGSRTVNMYNTTSQLWIGGDGRPGNAQNFKGSIKSVAMYKGLRTAAQISADHSADFYDVSDANMLFALDVEAGYDGFIPDRSANRNHANNTNWKPTEGQTFESGNIPFLTKDLAQAPYTYEAVIYAPMNKDRPGAIIANYPDNTGDSFMFEIKNGGKPSIYIYENGKAQINYSFNYDVRRNGFVHVALTQETSGSDTVFKCYVDGELVDTYTLKNYVFKMDMAAMAKTRRAAIGQCGRASLFWSGNMKSVTLRNKALTASEITASYLNGVDPTADNVIAHYDLSVPTDGFIKDLSGNGYHANFSNWMPSDGRSFTETEEPVYMSKDLTESPYTYEALVYAPMGVDRPGVIIGNYPNANGDSFQFEVKSGGKPGIYIYENGACQVNYAFNYDVRRSAWVHIAITLETDSGNSVFKCYVDGELVDTYTKTGYVFDMDMQKMKLTGPVSLGACVRTSLYWHGKMKSVALHNRALSADEIKASYANGVDAAADSLITYYDMTGEDATASVVKDRSGNGHDMAHLFYDKDFETGDYDYAFAVVGDTQFMVYQDASKGTDYTRYIYDYIVDNYDSKKIKYVFGLGDIIDNVDKAAEWAYAKDLITGTLGANNIPYSVIAGNHDFMRPYDTGFNDAFLNEPSLTKNITGYYKDGEVYNYYMNFEVEGTPYMLLALEYGANDDILAWANTVVASNKDRRVIITTHGYMSSDGTTLDGDDYAAPKPTGTTDANSLTYNNGDEMWNELVRKHANIAIVLSGHIDYNNIVMREDIGDHGNTVHQFLIDPQKMDKSYSYKTGMVAMLYFSNGGKDVSVEYVSTYRTAKAKEVDANAPEVLFNRANQISFTIKEAPASEDKGTIDLWLIAGQSNAAGYATGLPAEYAKDPRFTNGFDNVLYYGYSERWINYLTAIKAGLGNTTATSGAELGIAAALGNTDGMHAVIRYAQGATALYPTTVGNAAQNYGTWTSPSYIAANGIATDGTKTGLLYANFIDTVSAAIAELEALGYTPVIKGMWWMQGEEETYIESGAGAAAYESLLTALIKDVRADLGALVGEDLSAMPFVIGKVYTAASGYAYLAEVQAAQARVAASDPYAALIDPTEYASFAQQDNWHFNAATQAYLGKSFVYSVCDMRGEIVVETVGANTAFSGGGIYKKGDTVTVTAEAESGYNIASSSAVINGISADITFTDGKYTFVADNNTVIRVTAVNPNDVVTEYGVIPHAYASESSYPVVAFAKDKTFLGAYADLGTAINALVISDAKADYFILVRADIVNNKAGDADRYEGTLSIDLGGHNVSVTDASNYLLDLFVDDARGITTSVINFANGTITKVGGHSLICVNYAAGLTKDIKYTFGFNNITFVSTNNSKLTSVVFHTWENGYSAATAVMRVDATFSGCTFDYKSSVSGAVMLPLTRNGLDRVIYNVIIEGGTIVTGGSISYGDFVVADGNTNGRADSITFAADAAGNYISLDIPTGATPITSLLNNNTLVFKLKSDNGERAVYVLDTVEEPLVPESTPYGDIPVDYLSVTDYPMVVFREDKTFVGAYSEWGNAISSAVAAGNTGNYFILVRSDVNQTTNGTVNEFFGTMTVDLGGNTVYRGTGSYLIDAFIYDNSNIAGKKDVRGSITVKNGTISKGGNFAMCCLNYGGLLSKSAVYTYNFENVTFLATAGSNVIFETWEDGFNTVPAGITISADATFTNCTFDYASSVSGAVMFPVTFGGKNKAVFNITVNGGKIVANSAININKFFAGDDLDTLTFGKYNGKYTELYLPENAEAPAADNVWASTGGAPCIFVKSATEGGYTSYTLCPKVLSGFNVKSSVTLWTNFVYNVYVPASEYLTDLSIDGTAIDLSAASKVLLGDDTYYKISVVLPVSESLRSINLFATLTENGKAVSCSRSFDLIDYAVEINGGDYAAVEKQLACNMLSYARAAYSYFGVAGAEESIARINAILGDGYDTANKPASGVAKAPANEAFKSVTLNLGGVPAFRFYLADGYEAADLVFATRGSMLEVTEGTDVNGRYVELVMYAYRMCDDVTVSVSGSSATEVYNVYSYYEYALTVGDSVSLLVERLMAYSASAELYRQYVVEN